VDQGAELETKHVVNPDDDYDGGLALLWQGHR